MSLISEASATDTAILAVSLGAALFYGASVRNPPSILRTAAKTISTALLSVWIVVSGGPLSLAIALALGALGDAILAWDHGDAAFLGGLSAFLAAHLFYVVLFVRIGGGREQLQADGWRIALAALVTGAGPAINALLIPRLSRGLRLPVIAYSAVIFCMFVSALAVDNNRIVSGALLFTTSDAILATERFLAPAASPHRAWMPYAVWVLYYVGQILIALGFSPEST